MSKTRKSDQRIACSGEFCLMPSLLRYLKTVVAIYFRICKSHVTNQSPAGVGYKERVWKQRIVFFFLCFFFFFFFLWVCVCVLGPDTGMNLSKFVILFSDLGVFWYQGSLAFLTGVLVPTLESVKKKLFFSFIESYNNHFFFFGHSHWRYYKYSTWIRWRLARYKT